MISPHLPFPVCRYQLKLSGFVFAVNTRTILHYSRMLIIYFEESETGLWRLPFAVNGSLNLSNRPFYSCMPSDLAFEWK